jgi:hypothetical protein
MPPYFSRRFNMADLVANDVTVTLNPEDTDFMTFNKVVMPTIAFGNGALTIPAGGIPLPDLAYFGLNKAIKGILPIPNGDGRSYVYDKANHKLAVFAPGGSGIQTYNPGGGDIFGAVNADSKIADQAAKPLNADYVDTLHAVLAGPAWAYSENLEVDVARNVCITLQAKNDPAGSVIPAGTYTFTVTGTFRGAAQVETISYVFAAAEGTIAQAKYRYAYGVKPFERITSVVITPAHLANLPVDLLIGVGIGTRLGLPSETLNNAEADILKVVNTGVDLAVAGRFDGTNKTVNAGDMANADNISIQYKAATSGDEMAGYAVPATSLGLVVIGQ